MNCGGGWKQRCEQVYVGHSDTFTFGEENSTLIRSLLLKDEHAAAPTNGKEINGHQSSDTNASDTFLWKEHLWHSQCHLVQIRADSK